MRLTKVKIKNYRTIEDLTLCFPTYYAAICGKNDSGKSNVLRTIRSIFPAVGPGFFLRETSISFKEDLPKWLAKDAKERSIEIEFDLTVDPQIDTGLHSFLTTYLS
ncbi:MAG TPA: AAA family ATPase [Candidatus Sulfotelmatobacter sp.]|nr:AAA family ATPase [Candidatus Sulfotelmatobacter sp.]